MDARVLGYADSLNYTFFLCSSGMHCSTGSMGQVKDSNVIQMGSFPWKLERKASEVSLHIVTFLIYWNRYLISGASTYDCITFAQKRQKKAVKSNVTLSAAVNCVMLVLQVRIMHQRGRGFKPFCRSTPTFVATESCPRVCYAR